MHISNIELQQFLHTIALLYQYNAVYTVKTGNICIQILHFSPKLAFLKGSYIILLSDLIRNRKSTP